MSILNDDLSVFEIGFRWAGHDPNRVRFRIPLSVRDNFRLILDAILSTHLECQNLSCEKYQGSDRDEAKFYLRYWENEIYECVEGVRFSRTLLKWARISRSDFKMWCERRNIPIPEFWFPLGWAYEHSWGDDSIIDESVVCQDSVSYRATNSKKLGADQRIAITCQEVAINLWKRHPEMTIASMVKHDVIQTLCGANHYVPESVRRWLSAVAPNAVKEKRGRPKKNGTDDEL